MQNANAIIIIIIFTLLIKGVGIFLSSIILNTGLLIGNFTASMHWTLFMKFKINRYIILILLSNYYKLLEKIKYILFAFFADHC